MKEIQLTRKQIAIVDDDDYAWLSQYHWLAMWCPKTRSYYAARNTTRAGGVKHHISMHRLIAGAGPKEYVDHANGDTLDNRRSNIRRCTPSDNQHNSRIASNNTSGFKGVCWDKHRGRWRVDIKGNFLGFFVSKEDAARAYDNKARELFGEFAAVNFPRDGERGCHKAICHEFVAGNKDPYKLSVNNTSGFRGVSYHKRTGKWEAYLLVHGVRMYLGVFISKEEAARVRDEKAKDVLGQQAILNFPKEDRSA